MKKLYLRVTLALASRFDTKILKANFDYIQRKNLAITI